MKSSAKGNLCNVRVYKSSPTGFHVDNVAAANALSGSLGLLDGVIRGQAHSDLDLFPDGDAIIFGGPTSTKWTEIAWEFEGPEQRRKKRNPNPILKLAYYGGSDGGDYPDRVAWNIEGVGARETANWPFVCDDPQRDMPRLIYPKYSKKTLTVDGRHGPILSDNYLLITRVPNFMGHKMAQVTPEDKWPALIVFEGNHGPGTRAVELLLEEIGAKTLYSLNTVLKVVNAFRICFI